MRQKDRHLAHFINLLDHSQTAYFEPTPMINIRVQVAGGFRSAKALQIGKELTVARSDGYTEFSLPVLRQYELVELR